MSHPITTVPIRLEHDVVLARQRAREIASVLGFDKQDQVRIATAVSEIARNAFRYAGEGKAEFELDDASSALRIRISDKGKGIKNLPEIMDGSYVSKTGMGRGIVGARRLMDTFDIQSAPGAGTTVVLSKVLSRKLPISGAEVIDKISAELASHPPKNPLDELRRQNQELIETLEELQQQKNELASLNQELEDTNRGVVALYAELDERANYLRRASELKTQFLSNMTHEFRTPLNSILGISKILLDLVDGPLTSEQERQVKFIEKAARELSETVNDLLDLAKVEAGKVTISPGPFRAQDLFGALRGLLRPLLAHNSSVSLTFEAPSDLPFLLTDESKVSQILRNLISNALKFTPKGEVRVTASADGEDWVVFSVVDTGIGIDLADQDRVFLEFSQVEGPLQAKNRGTGLGLPLARKLAELLGGTLGLKSKLGEGSTFALRIPRKYEGKRTVDLLRDVSQEVDPERVPVLVVEDNLETYYIYNRYLKGTVFQPIAAQNLMDARRLMREFKPAVIILDVLLAQENSWAFLADLKQNATTREIPVIVITMVDNERKAMGYGANSFHVKPADRKWLLRKLNELGPSASPGKGSAAHV